MEALKFLNKMEECCEEFRKTQNETYDDSDLAHFFSPKLKKFLIDNKKEVDALFKLRTLTPFQRFVTSYIWK